MKKREKKKLLSVMKKEKKIKKCTISLHIHTPQRMLCSAARGNYEFNLCEYFLL